MPRRPRKAIQPLPPALVRAAKEETRRRIRDDRRGAPQGVAELLRVIEQRLYEADFNVDDLKRRCTPTAETLLLFRHTLDVNPKPYIERRRAETARRLLCESRAELSEIAGELGFDDAELFSKWFKRRTGCSPSKLLGSESPEPATAPPREEDEGLFQTFHKALVGAAGPEDAAEVIRRLRAECADET